MAQTLPLALPLYLIRFRIGPLPTTLLEVYLVILFIVTTCAFGLDILPNTVEVFVGYLRNKLGKPDLITTVRGFGYKIEG
jgi:hypothetical protein